MSAPIFLTADWRHLAMVNWAIDPALLAARVPAGCELDSWEGRTYVSAVGFMMQGTRVLGVPVPFHRDFEEVNLRFYVRHRGPEGWRRGVCFVKEIVPKAAIARTAQLLYNEPYVALPMRHAITAERVGYGWAFQGRWCELEATLGGPYEALAPGSEAEFIAEHYWGYTAQRDGGTVEYQVEHPPWRAAVAAASRLEAPVAALWGPDFAPVLAAAPTSAFVAEGSAVAVRRGVRL